MKKVLVLCTGNSCRSIIAEARINAAFGHRGIRAYSAGSRPKGHVNPLVKRLLGSRGIWKEDYHSKTIDEVEENGPFDLVVTVCDQAKESCPIFEGRSLHIGFEDPDGKPFEAFEKTYEAIGTRLLSSIEKELL